MSDERRARIRERVRRERARRTRPRVVADVELLTGQRPTLDDFLSTEATDRLMSLYLVASNRPDAQRQTWTTELGSDVAAAAAVVAEQLAGVDAFWLHARASEVGAVRAAMSSLLTNVRFKAGDYDVVLVSDEAEDGLRLAWDHLPTGGEYELVLWGRFRR